MKILICFLMALNVLGASDTREGFCTHASQIIFLEPPTGFSAQFEVSGCFCEYQGKVLFLLRNADKPQGSSWCAPGGKILLNETAIEALIREVKEEMDILLKEESITYCRPVFVKFPNSQFILHLFRYAFEDTPPNFNLALEENTDYRWVRYEEAAELPLIPGGKECFCIVFKDKL